MLAQRLRTTVKLLRRETPDFIIAPNLLLLNICDFRLVAYRILAVIQDWGPVDPKFQVEGITPTNHSSSRKTRLNDLSNVIKIWTDLSSVLSQCTRLADRRTDRILIARPHPHSMQRGNEQGIVFFRLTLYISIPPYDRNFKTGKTCSSDIFLDLTIDWRLPACNISSKKICTVDVDLLSSCHGITRQMCRG